jgi:hypothetical protein
MIISGLLSGISIVFIFIYPWISDKFRSSPRASTLGQIHRSNRKLGKTALLVLLFILLLPVNFAVMPIIIANAIAWKHFNSACDGWQTSYILYGIPSNNGTEANGDFLYNGALVGFLDFSGAETGWRVMYTRAPQAPQDFNDDNLLQIIYDEGDLGQTFTTQCNTVNVQNATASTIDCTTGSALSFVMYDTASNISVFTDNQVPSVSLIFTPPATSFSANYSNWQDGPPLGSLIDQNMNEQIKVVRSGSGNPCTSATKVCGRGLLESYAAMAYVWRNWQEWGMGLGNCIH